MLKSNKVYGNYKSKHYIFIKHTCCMCKSKLKINASSVYVYSESGSFYRATKQCAEILIKNFLFVLIINF